MKPLSEILRDLEDVAERNECKCSFYSTFVLCSKCYAAKVAGDIGVQMREALREIERKVREER